MIMNPIPGEAGTDYPVYSSVPDTGFNCAQQDFPGIYADTQADCQVEDILAQLISLLIITCTHLEYSGISQAYLT